MVLFLFVTWEQRKLGEVTQYATSSLKIADCTDEGEFDLYDANSVIGKTNFNVQTEDYITIIKDGSGVGTVRLLPKNTSFIGTMGAILAKNSEIEFIYALLQRFDFSQHINGATIPHVYYSEYKQDIIYAPIRNEQRIIGKIFKQLDNLITLHQRKYDKIVNIKKALLEKMFPSDAETTPKIRFKGFTDAWEQRKLGEVTQYATSSLKIADCTDEGEFDLYDANSVIGKTNFNVQTEDYITIIKDGSGVGTVRLLPKNTSFIGTMGAILAKNSEIEFIYALLQRFDFSQHINGATIPHVYYSEYKQDIIYAPIRNEQRIIGKIFKQLDNLITLHQRGLIKIQGDKNGKKRSFRRIVQRLF